MGQKYILVDAERRMTPAAGAVTLVSFFFLALYAARPASQVLLSSSLLHPGYHPHHVHNLPDLPAEYNRSMYAGFVPVNSDMKGDTQGDTQGDKGSLFYWLFTSEKEDADTPLVIWLNGGPGASSLTGALLENGPIRLNADGTTSYNQFG